MYTFSSIFTQKQGLKGLGNELFAIKLIKTKNAIAVISRAGVHKHCWLLAGASSETVLRKVCCCTDELALVYVVP